MAAKGKKPAPKAAPKRAARPKAKRPTATNPKAKRPNGKVSGKPNVHAASKSPTVNGAKAVTRPGKAVAKAAAKSAGEAAGKAGGQTAVKKTTGKAPAPKAEPSLRGEAVVAKGGSHGPASRVSAHESRSGEKAAPTTEAAMPVAQAAAPRVSSGADNQSPTTGAAAMGATAQESSPPGLPVPIASFTI